MGIFKNWFKNNNLVVCGDSFGTIDARQDVDKQWPNLLNATTLARAGACSTYIHAQVKYAVEELEADELIVWSTSADRFIFPIQPNKKSQSITPSLEPRSFNPSDWEDAEITAGPIKANTIRTNLREFKGLVKTVFVLPFTLCFIFLLAIFVFKLPILILLNFFF